MVVQKLVKHFAGKLVALSAPGYAQIITFRGQAAVKLMTVNDDEDDDVSSNINTVSNQVIKECKDLRLDKSAYHLDLNIQKAEESISDTLLAFLSTLSPKLSHSLPSVMIGNMITAMLKNEPTNLQVAFGVLLRDSKKILGYMHDYGITCCYNEVLRFKKSAAVAASTDTSSLGNAYPLDALGNMGRSLQDATQQATPFILSCYGLFKCKAMIEGRHRMWSLKVAKTVGGAPKLESLPPTTEAFEMMWLELISR